MTTVFEAGEVQIRTPHLAADLLELLISIDYFGKQRVSKNDALSAFVNFECSPEELDEIVAEEDDDNIVTNKNERNSKLERQIEDIWSQLSYRDKAFDFFYPFNVENEQISINSSLKNEQKYYLFLLACSRLRSFKAKGICQKWAKLFTEIAKNCLINLLPESAIVKIFDANSDDRKSYYSTDLRQAVRKLCADLGARIHEDECQRLSSSGDAGIDLVGIVPFNDNLYSNFAILGQCACQEKNWPSKTIEAHQLNIQHLISQFHSINAVFIPISYRDSDGAWVNNKHTNLCLLVDRLRILKTLSQKFNWDNSLISEFESDFNKFKIEF